MSLNVAARVSFAAERRSDGRRVGGRCVRPSRSNPGRTRCALYVRLAAGFTRSLPAGVSRFTFSGRLGGGVLRSGHYNLLVTPTAGGRTGATGRVRFSIVT